MFSPVSKHLKQNENKLHNNVNHNNNKISELELEDQSIKSETSFPFERESSQVLNECEDASADKLRKYYLEQYDPFPRKYISDIYSDNVDKGALGGRVV